MPSANNYSFFDRILHRFAFCHPIVQKILSELENDLFKKELKTIHSRNEVFITGLPRAGTTLMLELLNATGDFGTYSYRNMPFVVSPLLWDKLSRSFRKAGQEAERAHGDGMQISFDSPEAFEEVVWLTHMADEIVGEQCLEVLSPGDISEESADALRNSVRKILVLAKQAGHDPQRLRYLSKNNANISRINAIQEIFPTSSILVLFRHPLAHVSSLVRQHERFLDVHANDAFSKQYMKWIGHYEFGENFKPINFCGWLNDADMSSPVDETFWMRYWSAAYSYALERKTSSVHFVDFDRMLQDREVSLAKIAKAVRLEHDGALIGAAKTLRSPTSRPLELGSCNPEVWTQVQDVHARLKSVAV